MNIWQVLALVASLLLGLVNGYNNWKQGQEVDEVRAELRLESREIPSWSVLPPRAPK